MQENDDILASDADGYGRHSTGILPSHVLTRLLAAGRELTESEPFTA
jgi:hypothetical protein